ncbi:helix-turn-helix domain-containing protein [Corynebacterium sp.]|uniref:winged helix-turn-helix transcriptional regulator n=1 Tax=Corynebacterium sp. TaxID=1720 RepID=UPI0026DC477C|nr:helix-turn-helix domain-containing protein [Corynebacterium sp.]MDO5076438.1 helix-turn-helix domain-containing protein [Corynebacterium sp.]
MADKWTPLIIGRLDEGPHWFNQLKRSIPGVSQKMLTQTLRALERDGIVDREVFPTVPVTVVYSLTDLGRTLSEPLQLVREWVESHRDAVVSARMAFDEKMAEQQKVSQIEGIV